MIAPVGTCPTCAGLRHVTLDELPVGHPDFGFAYPCPRCRPQAYNASRQERETKRETKP